MTSRFKRTLAENWEKHTPQRYHFANKGLCSQSYGFPSSHVWMWELDTQKAEHWRTDDFELWCWRRLLRVSWTSRRSNQSILKESVLKLQYFGYLMRRTDSLEKTLVLGKTEGGRRRGWQRMTWLDVITSSMDMSLNKLRELVKAGKPIVLQSTGLQRVGHDCLSNWTELNWSTILSFFSS